MDNLLEIKLYPDPILRIKAKDLDLAKIKTPKIQELIKAMSQTMLAKDGVGLAAPQVAQDLRLITIATDNQGILVLINPKLTKKSWAKESEDEGCLSVLDKAGQLVFAPVSRHKKISCQYYDSQGKKKTINAEGFLARVIQHEIDHLNGILFIDYLPQLPDNID